MLCMFIARCFLNRDIRSTKSDIGCSDLLLPLVHFSPFCVPSFFFRLGVLGGWGFREYPMVRDTSFLLPFKFKNLCPSIDRFCAVCICELVNELLDFK